MPQQQPPHTNATSNNHSEYQQTYTQQNNMSGMNSVFLNNMVMMAPMDIGNQKMNNFNSLNNISPQPQPPPPENSNLNTNVYYSVYTNY